MRLVSKRRRLYALVSLGLHVERGDRGAGVEPLGVHVVQIRTRFPILKRAPRQCHAVIEQGTPEYVMPRTRKHRGSLYCRRASLWPMLKDRIATMVNSIETSLVTVVRVENLD